MNKSQALKLLNKTQSGCSSKMINAHAYNITVRQIEADPQVLFEARVRELPDVVDFGETWEEAYGLAVDAIETIAEMMTEQHRSMPQPADVQRTQSQLRETSLKLLERETEP